MAEATRFCKKIAMSFSGLELSQLRDLINSVLDEREKAKANQPEPARRDLTKAEFARLKGIAASTPQRWADAGKLKLTPSGRISPEEAKRHGVK